MRGCLGSAPFVGFVVFFSMMLYANPWQLSLAVFVILLVAMLVARRISKKDYKRNLERSQKISDEIKRYENTHGQVDIYKIEEYEKFCDHMDDFVDSID